MAIGRKPRSIENADRNAEIERLLIDGELVKGEDGKEERVFPKGQDIAARLGVSRAWVSKYATTNKCFERRAARQAAIRAKASEKLARMEVDRIAFDLDAQLSLCDGILAKYAEAIESRGVGNVTASDINTVVRLRHFIKGDADSRVATQQQNITLEDMQEAHARLFQASSEADESHPSGVTAPALIEASA